MNCNDMAYMRGRSDARRGLKRFPQSQHPDQYGYYNAGYRDWHKLQAFPDVLAALKDMLDLMGPLDEIANIRRKNVALAAIAKAESAA